MTTVTRSIGDYLLSTPNESNQTMTTATNEATAEKATNLLSGAIGRKLDQAHQTFYDFARRVGDGVELKEAQADELLAALPLIGKQESDFYASVSRPQVGAGERHHRGGSSHPAEGPGRRRKGPPRLPRRDRVRRGQGGGVVRRHAP
jgi:hypothetical protein